MSELLVKAVVLAVIGWVLAAWALIVLIGIAHAWWALIPLMGWRTGAILTGIWGLYGFARGFAIGYLNPGGLIQVKK